jgi:dTDP-glucose 4,6-dehydratase
MGAIIVTGGAGFIGCNLVRHLLDRRTSRVVVVDALTYAGHPENLAGLESDPRYGFVRADIGDAAAISQLLAAERPVAVVNLAAETHVDRSIDGPRAFVRTNVVGTFELLEAVRIYWANLPPTERAGFRFVHVSTDEVFGSLAAAGRFEEHTAYAPNSPYAATKAAGDHLVRAYHATFGLPTLVTNCSNNYGPYQFPEKLIPLMILSALEGRDLPIYGDGGNVRDWIYVEDHCTGLVRVLEDGRVGESYNLGAEQELTNLEIVDRICAALEAVRPARENPALAGRGVNGYGELKRFVSDRPGHDRRYAIDATKSRTHLGWRPEHAFDEALALTVGWYLEHRDWCAAVSRAYRGERLGLGAGAGELRTTPAGPR